MITEMTPGISVVLLGMTGTGKSAAANTILGTQRFRSRASSKPVTTECQAAEKEINGVHVQVIDTPDIFDDDMDASVRAEHVKRCRQLCGSAPPVYLLVMHVSRFTDGERDALVKLERAFGSRAAEKTVLLFTRGEDLRRAGMSLDDFLRSCHPGLREMVERCGRRCVLFEKSSSNQSQVAELLETVDGMFRDDGASVHPVQVQVRSAPGSAGMYGLRRYIPDWVMGTIWTRTEIY